MSRKADYVIGRDKLPIVGLSQNRNDGRFYATHSRPRKWFGKNFDHALIRFREWQDQQNPSKVKIYTSDITPEQQAQADGFLEVMRELVVAGGMVPDLRTGKLRPVNWERMSEHAQRIATHRDYVEVGGDRFWTAVREQILADVHLAAQRTGLPLDRLHLFKPPTPSITLDEVEELYKSKPKELTAKTKRDMRVYWAEFKDITQARTVADITVERVNKYHDEVYRLHREGKRSPAFVKAKSLSTITRQHGSRRVTSPDFGA